MSEKRIDLKAALRELAGEESEGVGPHVGLKRLIAYHRGTLSTTEREALQEHLSLCVRCTGLLRELRDFEAASAGGDAGPESLRQDAWDSLVRRLPPKEPGVRPIAGAFQREVPRLGRFRYAIYGIAAVLLLSVLGLSVWAAVTVQQERRRLARLEQRLAEREEALTSARRSLADAERQLAAAHGHIQGLEKEKVDRSRREDATLQQERRRLARLEQRLAEREEALTSVRRSLANAERQFAAARGHIQDLEKEKVRLERLEQRLAEREETLASVRRSLANAERQLAELADPVIEVTAESPGQREIEVAVAPRFDLRDQQDQQKAERGFLRGEGAVNPVRIRTQREGFTVALSLTGHPVYRKYRLELIDRNGEVLWADRRRRKALLGDIGTSVSVSWLLPGVYRLRIDGLKAGRSERLAEYVLAVEWQETPQ